MSERPRQFLLLTATVRPNTTTKLAVVSPAVRLSQYRSALAKWVETAKALRAEIIVVETSGADRATFIGELDDADRALVRFVNYSPSTEVIARGIGYIEWSAIRHALDQLRLREDDTVYKVTGRLVVTNPEQVFGVLPSRTVRLRTRVDGSHSDTRVVGGTVGTWRSVLLPAADDVDYARRIEIEHTVAARVRLARTLGAVDVSSFPRRPLYAGQSGTNGSTYSPWKTFAQGVVVRPFEPLVAFASRSISR